MLFHCHCGFDRLVRRDELAGDDLLLDQPHNLRLAGVRSYTTVFFVVKKCDTVCHLSKSDDTDTSECNITIVMAQLLIS